MEDCLKLNSDGKFDVSLTAGQVQEAAVRDLLWMPSTIEIKTEFDVWQTSGNVFIEVLNVRDSSNIKPSGISVTTSDFWCISLARVDKNNESYFSFFMKTDVLKRWLKANYNMGDLVLGGDKDKDGEKTVKGWLVPMVRLIEVAKYD